VVWIGWLDWFPHGWGSPVTAAWSAMYFATLLQILQDLNIITPLTYKKKKQITLVDNISKHMWQTISAYHVSEYTWHNQMMTSVKNKLACAMSTSDVRKLCHSGRIASGVSPPRNVKSSKVLKDGGSNSLSVVNIGYTKI
jgi:hypothetical protein